VSTPTAHLPAKEVLRFGGAIFLRILFAVLFGLAALKTIQALVRVTDAQAVQLGEWAATGFFVLSLLIRRIPWPEIDYGPDIDPSVLDEETAP